MAQDVMDWLMSDYEGIEHYFEFTYVKPAPMAHGKVFYFVGVIRLESPFVEEFLDFEGDGSDVDLVKAFKDRGLVIRGAWAE